MRHTTTGFLRCDRRASALLVVAIFLLSSAFGKTNPVADPVSLIRNASELSDIWSVGPVRLRIKIKFLAVKAGTIDASYEKTSSWQKWRATLSSSEFSGITAGSDGKVWEWSNPSEKPLRVWQFERALAALSQYPIGKGLRYSVHNREGDPHGDKLTCVQVQNGQTSIQDCFSRDTGALRALREITWSYLYSDYESFGGKLYPHRITVLETFKPVVVAEVVELENLAAVDPVVFEPPKDTQARPVCKEGLGIALGPSGGKLLKQVTPTSPSLLPNSGILSNDMIVSGVVGRDGRFRYLHADGTNQLTAKATYQAVQQWQFEPFTVCGFPVEMPLAFTVNFDKTGRYVGRFGP